MQNFSDTIGQVFRAMLANKLRTFLTMFGIAWGVGSLLVLVGLGRLWMGRVMGRLQVQGG